MTQISHTLREARQSFLNGDQGGAFAIYEQILDEHPRSAEVLLDYGRARFQTGDFEEAAQVLERAVAVAPDNLEALLWLATVAWMEYGPGVDAAPLLFRRAIELAPKDPDAYIGLGMCLHAPPYTTGIPLAEGVAAFRTAAALAPSREDAHHNLGIALLEAGDRQGALVELRVAAELRARVGDHAGAEHLHASIDRLEHGEAPTSRSFIQSSKRFRWPSGSDSGGREHEA